MDVKAALLEWYRPRTSIYPWRADPPDPYWVLVSEVMLQQTQAARVETAFPAFVSRFPTLVSLAAASKSEVLRTWVGLGYNRRAVALSEAARTIVREHVGAIPADPDALMRLPGVGSYTAAAVASIGYGVPVPALDTNARRVVARAILGTEPGQAPPGALRVAVHDFLDRSDPGAWNQAVMDLGRDVCRAVPRCGSCPLASWCRFRRGGGQLASSSRRQPRFEGSSRQVRGAIVRSLLERSPATLASLTRATGFEADRVTAAVFGLSSDGLVSASPAALAGKLAGRVRLAD